MKDLSLNRLIPLAAGAVLALGCGGRSVTQTEDKNGFPDGDPAKADPDDPEQYEDALESLTQDFCRDTMRCAKVNGSEYYSDYADYFDTVDECGEFYIQTFEARFSLDESNCREQLLKVLDCFNSTTGCSYSDRYDSCEAITERFTDNCYEEEYYDYYDYSSDSGPDYQY